MRMHMRKLVRLGQVIADRTGSLDHSASAKHLFQIFQISLWRGNACLWLHRHPTLPPALDGIARVFLSIFFCFFLDVCIEFYLVGKKKNSFYDVQLSISHSKVVTQCPVHVLANFALMN